MNLFICLILSCASFTVFIPAGHAQISRKAAALSIGYQYADFGHSMPAAEIDLLLRNASIPDGGNKFTNVRHGMGAVVRLTMPYAKEGGGFAIDLTLGNKRVSDQARYDTYNADSSVAIATTVGTRLRYRYLGIGANYAWKRFSLGASADLGMFASLIRYKYEGGSDPKWQPWFSSPKVFGSGYTGKSPVISGTLSAGFLLTHFLELRVSRQVTLFGMGATLSDHYFSINNWSAELTFRICPNELP